MPEGVSGVTFLIAHKHIFDQSARITSFAG
jgi:hypothetical protein